MMPRLLLLMALAAAALPACGGPPEPRVREPVHERRPTVVAWDTAWVRGGPADSLLLMPLDVVANDELVHVLDGGGKRVVALRADDGTVAWIVGGAGGGPGEFAAPVTLTLAPGGSLLVSDHQNARISVISSTGQVTGHIPFRDFTYAQGICALADGDLVLIYAGDRAPHHPDVA